MSRSLAVQSRFVALTCVAATMALLATAAASAAPGEKHRFTYKPPVAGQSLSQDLRFSLELKTSTIQAGKTIEEVDSVVERRQQRSVTVIDAATDRITKASVRYDAAEQEIRHGQEKQQAKQPIAGKTYIVARSKPTDKLSVTDEEGGEPSAAELAIVSGGMDAIGRVNPLGGFFDKREVAVGETVALPQKLAREMLGYDDTVGETTKFDLTLARVVEREGVKCGEFDARIDVKPADPTSPPTRFRGRFVLELATCRGVEADFAGPVSFVETHGPQGARYQVQATGALRMNIKTSTSAVAGKTDATPRR